MLFVLFVNLCQLTSADDVVQTTSGPIRGIPSLVGEVEAYLGIPYAEAPVGQLRFAKPVPKENWNETYDASTFPLRCSQLSAEIYSTSDTIYMSEDCLYLNIWVPSSNSSRGLRPVIIYIHGEGLSAEDANGKLLDGSNLAKQGDLIFASINYRLGALGFFSSFTEDAAGNMGMYDQIMAIKWLKENAESFGGDSENIVLMGNGAGASSVAAHMLSPLSKGLFKKAILQSGSIWNPLFDDDNDRLLKSSQSVATHTGCSNETSTLENEPDTVIDCLKNVTVKAIIEAEKNVQKFFPSVFYPRIKDDFLPESTINLFRKGKFEKDISVLTGVTYDEGAYFLTDAFPEHFGIDAKNNVQALTKESAIELIQPVLLFWNETNGPEITDYYSGLVKNGTSIEYLKMVANILGDFGVTCNTYFTANVLSLKGNPVYFYKFAFKPSSTPLAEWVGPTHMDELQYVLGNPFYKDFTPKEQELSDSIIGRWSAFAWTGNPNIPGHLPWLRYSYHNPIYLNIEQEEESIRLNPAETCEIWKKRFKAEVDTPLIRFLRNSGLNLPTE